MMRREDTYCNPLPVENYPRGADGPDRENQLDYRSMADPTVLYFEGKWYMYPTYRMAYVSDDMVHWRHAPIEPANVGPAPTVALHRGRFLLTACGAPLYASDGPLGPFTSLGAFRRLDGSEMRVADPMIFVDDDDRLYLYWGLGDPGIFGVELDGGDPTRFLGEPVCLLAFDPAHTWERFGDDNQDAGRSSLEGAWMIKANGRYYLTYAGPGTCYRTYAMGAYVSDEGPLAGFRYQARNPILRTTSGLMKGPGHGCIVKAPDGQLWAYYTSVLCYAHKFERRIGLDPAGIDEDGNLYVSGATDTPQYMPGILPAPQAGNAAPLVPLTFANPVSASSCAPGRDAVYATNDTLLDWWQPDAADPDPTLTVALRAWYDVSAIRVLWRDVGMDFATGALPGPFRYVVEGEGESGWQVLLDASQNAVDINCDYRTFAPAKVSRVRLRITGWPRGIAPGVMNFTAFGIHAGRLEGA